MKRTFKIVISLLLFVLLFFISTPAVLASNLQCEKRYLTLVNPVRGRNLWLEQSFKPIKDQYSLIAAHNFPASWLLQYDVLLDPDLISEIKQFNSQQEKGVFLEISADLARDAGVLYPQQTPWFKPNAVFLSGYSQSGRRKLVDQIFYKFRQTFGIYPKSVGAWWIDSYSLKYLQQKYKITSALIVADQLSTDNYGVWGQWWGLPFYPARANILEPASTNQNKLPVVITQWAQRDPLRSYGNTKSFSNYSIQANDYSSQGLTIDYFKEITSLYLDCSHSIGQITVGLETGQESISFIGEYARQLNYLQTLPSLKAVTLSDFAKQYAQVYPQFSKSESLNYLQSQWDFSPSGRSNLLLHDSTAYNQNLSFSDYFIADGQSFLDRKLPLKNKESWYFPWWLLASVGGIFFFNRKKIPLVGLAGVLFAVSSYGLVLCSFYQYGWKIYFGPVVDLLPLVQIGLVLAGFAAVYGWLKILNKLDDKNKLTIFLPALVFGLDSIIESARLTKLEGITYGGFIIDTFHFVGLRLGKNIQLVNQDFSPAIAGALLKIDFGKVWANTWIWLIIYPLIHLTIASVLFFLLKKMPPKISWGILGVLGILWIIFLLNLFLKDPLIVKPITESGFLSLLQ